MERKEFSEVKKNGKNKKYEIIIIIIISSGTCKFWAFQNHHNLCALNISGSKHLGFSKLMSEHTLM